jgi:hypothetical protein
MNLYEFVALFFAQMVYVLRTVDMIKFGIEFHQMIWGLKLLLDEGFKKLRKVKPKTGLNEIKL